MAVPLNEADFRSAWRRGSDFLRGTYPDVEEGWRNYREIAEAAGEICRGVEAAGGALVAEASLRDLAAGAGSFPAITVIAHMNFPPVAACDVVGEAELRQFVISGTEPEWQMLRAEVREPIGAAEIVAAINRLLEATHRALNSTPTSDIRNGQRLARQRGADFGLLRLDRPRIDELCGPEVLRPGRGIEMSEGMVSAREFVVAIPPGFEGFLDLRMCNSISLGAAVRRSRPLARVAAGKRRLHLDGPLLLYEAALLYMEAQSRAGDRANYEDVMAKLSEDARERL